MSLWAFYRPYKTTYSRSPLHLMSDVSDLPLIYLDIYRFPLIYCCGRCDHIYLNQWCYLFSKWSLEAAHRTSYLKAIYSGPSQSHWKGIDASSRCIKHGCGNRSATKVTIFLRDSMHTVLSSPFNYTLLVMSRAILASLGSIIFTFIILINFRLYLL